MQIKSNFKAVHKEIFRLDGAPDRAALTLDTIFHTGFAATQAKVHVITGSLKSSGRAETEFTGEKWQGEISYGGISEGVNNPVNYAIYEKRRDEGHDFFIPLKALDSLYVKAILKALS